MQVQDTGAPGSLVQVIDVLRDHLYFEVVLEGCDGAMCRVGLGGQYLGPAQVIETQHFDRIMRPSLRRRHLFYPVLLPQAVTVTEGAQTALGADPGTGENNDPRTPHTLQDNRRFWVPSAITGFHLFSGPSSRFPCLQTVQPIALLLPPSLNHSISKGQDDRQPER